MLQFCWFPFLKIGISLAVLMQFGGFLELKDKFIMSANGLEMFRDVFLLVYC